MRAEFRLRDPRQFVALGFGAGLVPRAPGTAGSFVALLVPWLLQPLGLFLYLAATGVAFVFGCWVCGATAQAVGVHDHPSIVWDEVVGVMIVFIAVPISPWSLAVGFLVFRILDITKPWPISVLDRRLTGGIGIMLDDAVAAAIGLAVMQAALWGLRAAGVPVG